MDRLRNCYDVLHPYATQTIRFHAQRLARGTLFPGMTAEDHQQELALDLWRRLPAYDPERAGLATFIDRIVRRRVSDLITSAHTAARDGERQTMSLDSAEDGDGAALADQLSTSEGLWAGPADLEHEVSLRHDLGRFIALLPPALRRCCAILMSGSVGEAIQKESLHRSSYYEGLGRLRRRARDAGLHHYLADPDKSENRSVSNHRERPARA
jgi:DNA-directed RNA polymerase specialized sigma24 family protein